MNRAIAHAIKIVASIAAILLFSSVSVNAQVSPMAGIATYQLLDNTGKPTAGALYFYLAGTSTQAPTFTDYTGTVQNPNPLAVGAGGRATVWLTTGAFYKVVGCLSALDGPTCAAGDILFSIDQIPGGSTSGGGVATAPFITTTPTPATTGILRLASGDSAPCWRNAANSANLCWSKDGNDLLSWAAGSLKFPEVGAPGGVSMFDILWADATAHRWKMANNGGSAVNVVASGVDINTSDQVTQWHFGSTATPLSGTVPTTNQFLQWNGTNIVGRGPAEFVVTAMTGGTTPAGSCNAAAVCNLFILPSGHTLVRLVYQLFTSPSGCSTAAVLGLRDITSSTNIGTLTVTNGLGTGLIDSGPLSVATTGGDQFQLGLITAEAGCSVTATVGNLNAVFQE